MAKLPSRPFITLRVWPESLTTISPAETWKQARGKEPAGKGHMVHKQSPNRVTWQETTNNFHSSDLEMRAPQRCAKTERAKAVFCAVCHRPPDLNAFDTYPF